MDLSLSTTPKVAEMQALAEKFQTDKSGFFSNINTDRLSARIPVIMLKAGNIDVDISPENALAIMNTKLLKCYSKSPLMVPLVRMLKKIVKSFDINNPAKGSLSSYGYVLMALHYLQTFGSLPNLQNLAFGPDNRIIAVSPQAHMKPLSHPRKDGFVCNVHFLCPTSQNQLQILEKYLFQMVLQDEGNNILAHLAKFFYYFAFLFDYRHNIVGTTSSRQQKAEEYPEYFHSKSFDLSIQDPFETFYDVGHVVKPSQWFRIRTVFARCYSKIASLVSHAHQIGQKSLSLTFVLEELVLLAEEDKTFI